MNEARTITVGERIHEINRPDDICIVEAVHGPDISVAWRLPREADDGVMVHLREFGSAKVYDIAWDGTRWFFPKITFSSYIEDVLMRLHDDGAT